MCSKAHRQNSRASLRNIRLLVVMTVLRRTIPKTRSYAHLQGFATEVLSVLYDAAATWLAADDGTVSTVASQNAQRLLYPLVIRLRRSNDRTDQNDQMLQSFTFRIAQRTLSIAPWLLITLYPLWCALFAGHPVRDTAGRTVISHLCWLMAVTFRRFLAGPLECSASVVTKALHAIFDSLENVVRQLRGRLEEEGAAHCFVHCLGLLTLLARKEPCLRPRTERYLKDCLDTLSHGRSTDPPTCAPLLESQIQQHLAKLVCYDASEEECLDSFKTALA